MSRDFPDFIDPWRSAEGSRRIGGTIPLTRFKRLMPLLASGEGEATFKLQFGYDAQRRPFVDADVSAPLPLICQRSLEPYVEQIAQLSRLQIIAEAGEQALLSVEEEYVVADEGHLAVADLVEDELLLAIPQVPRNPHVQTVWATSEADAERGDHGAVPSPQAGSTSGEKRQRPFSDLAEMMKKNQT